MRKIAILSQRSSLCWLALSLWRIAPLLPAAAAVRGEVT
jgi:hypothetical protein